MIAVCPNPYRDIELVFTKKCVSLLADAGFETVICPVFSDPGDEALPADIETKKLSEVIDEVSMAIVIGGDGTVLSVVRDLGDYETPVLGINLGTMGFMTSLEPEDIALVVNAARGRYPVSRRMKIDVTLSRSGEVIYSGTALNDAVIHGYGDSILLHAECDGQKIISFSGDGIVISSPTGSTGYSLSAGGPIVEPEAKNLIVAPICAHTMCSRTFVLGKERTVTVMAEKLHDRRAYLSVDGYVTADVHKDDLLTVKSSDSCVCFVDPGVRSFYENTFEKLT